MHYDLHFSLQLLSVTHSSLYIMQTRSLSVDEKYTLQNKETVFRLTNLRAALEQCKDMFMLRSSGLMQPGQHVTEVPQWVM